VESGCTNLLFSSNWGIEYQRWKTIVTLGCFGRAGTHVLVDIEAANRPPNCLPVTKDENDRLVDFALETGVKTRLNACFEQEFATMCIMIVPLQPDEMVTRTSLVFGPLTLWIVSPLRNVRSDYRPLEGDTNGTSFTTFNSSEESQGTAPPVHVA